MSMIEIAAHITQNGQKPFSKWLRGLDKQARDKVMTALDRLEEGNTGNLKSVGSGVYELKITYGPGYRIYFGWANNRLVILLHGGTKKRQSDDIAKAKELWEDYKLHKQI